MDLVERLRAEAEGMPKDYIKHKAADEIERLRNFVKTFDWFEDDRWLNDGGHPDEDQWEVIKSKRATLQEQDK